MVADKGNSCAKAKEEQRQIMWKVGVCCSSEVLLCRLYEMLHPGP